MATLFQLVSMSFVGLGALLTICAAFMSQGRFWAAAACVGLSGIATLLALAFNVFLLLNVVITPLAWLMLAALVIACASSPFALAETRRVSKARSQLYLDD